MDSSYALCGSGGTRWLVKEAEILDFECWILASESILDRINRINRINRICRIFRKEEKWWIFDVGFWI